MGDLRLVAHAAARPEHLLTRLWLLIKSGHILPEDALKPMATRAGQRCHSEKAGTQAGWNGSKKLPAQPFG